jgi:hypothetical protein
MKIVETYTSSAGIVESDPAIDQPRTYTIGSFRFRGDIVKLCPIPYADAEATILYAPRDVNQFMLTKPA